MKAETIDELLDAARNWKYVGMSFVAADRDGHIGRRASGAAPLRRGYTGRLPGDASSGADWDGFLPFEDMPSLRDPPEGFIATANYVPERYSGPRLSHIWCAPYRFRRIVTALQGMRRPGVEEFRRLQLDVHSAQADRIVPALASLPLGDPRAREAVRLLAGWDREVRADSAAAALFEVFLVTADPLPPVGQAGRRPRPLLQRPLRTRWRTRSSRRPRSPLWNGDMPGTVTRALVGAMDICAREMGADARRWRWGRLHRYTFRHRGASGRLAAWLLNPPPVPADGDNGTINVSWSSSAAGSYDVTTIPSMRMVAALGDPDGLFIVGPLGQSGQPGHPHYEDMTRMWAKGRYVRIPLTEEGVRTVTRERLVLEGSS